MAAVAAVLAAAAIGVPQRAVGAQTVSVSPSSTSTIRVNAATAGQPPTAVSMTAGTYYFSTGSSARRLQARLSAAPPTGVTIQVSVTTHASATNVGWVTLTTTYQDIVTNYPRSSSGTYLITYRITATSAAGVLSAQSRTVTLRNAA